MKRIQKAAHCSRVTLDPGQRIEKQAPAAVLSLAQIVNLAEKRLRWYGFCDWRIHDVICNHDQTVAVQVRSRNEVVATLTFARDCGVVHYGIHMPAALKIAPAFAVHTAIAPRAAGVRESAKRPSPAQQRREVSAAERKKGAAKTAIKRSAKAPSAHVPSVPEVDMPPDYNEPPLVAAKPVELARGEWLNPGIAVGTSRIPAASANPSVRRESR